MTKAIWNMQKCPSPCRGLLSSASFVDSRSDDIVAADDGRQKLENANRGSSCFLEIISEIQCAK